MQQHAWLYKTIMLSETSQIQKAARFDPLYEVLEMTEL